MAKYTIEDTTLTNIADAIRTKGNTTDTLTPEQMPNAIDAIEAGSVGNEGVAGRIGTGFMPSQIDSYVDGGRRYYSTSAYQTVYYWRRLNYTNIYWQVCAWNPSKFIEGQTYRMTTWIWHSGDDNKDPIPFWQTNIFFNGSINVANPLKEITTTPQLLTITFTYKADSSYGAVFYLYPEASYNEIRLLPIVVENLSYPATNYPTVAI